MITHIFDLRAIASAMKGGWAMSGNFQGLARSQVGVPDQVMVRVAVAVARKRSETLELRFRRLTGQIARMPWSAKVEKRFITLMTRSKPLDELDAIVAAHALVSEAKVITVGESPLRRLRGIAVEDWK